MTLAADILFSPSAARSREDVLCAHCNLPVPSGLIEADADEQFCCAGCRAVYQTLHACGLDAYYRLREAAEVTPHPAKPSDSSFQSFDSPTFHELYVQQRGDGIATADLALEGVTCAACVWLVERLPRILDGVIEARLSLREAMLRVTWDKSKLPLSKIARALDRIGYTPHPAKGISGRELHRRESRKRLIHLGVAGAIMGNTMLLALALYAGNVGHMEERYRMFFRWTSLLLATISLAWPGATFFRSAWAAIRMRTTNLDVPIALALAVGGIAGLVNVVVNRGEIYFDSLTVLVFLLLVGRFIQYRQQRRADDAVGLLFSLTPASCRLVLADEVVDAPVEALKAGDLVEVRAGDLFPADGTIETGRSSVNQALLTGESMPVAVEAGSTVHAGSQNIASVLRVRVEKVGRDTRVGQLMHLIERGVQDKPPIVQFADKVGGWFVAVVTIVAFAVFAFWSRYGLSQGIDHAVALLIVTCPCVLGLATPMTIAIAVGKLARNDILVKSGAVIEKLSRGGSLLLDKTGTLTEGKLKLLEWIGDESVCSAVEEIEKNSNHPVGRALGEGLGRARTADLLVGSQGAVRSADPIGANGASSSRLAAPLAGRVGSSEGSIHVRFSRDFLEDSAPGRAPQAGRLNQGNAGVEIREVIERGDGGITATTSAGKTHIGSPTFVRRNDILIRRWIATTVREIENSGATAVIVARDQVAVAVAALGDRVRDDSAASIARLNESGFRPSILSGDAQDVVNHVARQVGIDRDNARGQLSPEQKLSIVEKSSTGIAIMVGDGVNDAAALAAADVGIAVHGGAEASLSAADVYIARPGLAPLVELAQMSRRAMRVIHRNLAVSLAYNILAGALAAAGIMTPMIAAIIMPISSATVLSIAVASLSRGGKRRGDVETRGRGEVSIDLVSPSGRPAIPASIN